MKKLSEKQKYLNWAIFAGVFVILMYFINGYTAYTLDSDAASELVLAKHLADEGAFLASQNWYYSTEFNFLCDTAFFRLLFLFTDNWHVVRLGGSFIMTALLMLGLYWLCLELGLKKSVPLLGALMLLPISRTYFDILLKFQYYPPFVITGFVVLAALFYFLRGKGVRMYAASALALILSLCAGLLGFRLFMTLYIPLVLAVIVYIWLNKAPEGTRKLLLGTGTVTGAALVGFVINQVYIVGNYSFHDYTTISFTSFSLDGVEKMLSGLLQLLGYRAGEEVFSKALLPTALSGILLLLCFYCAIYILIHRERFDAARQIAAYFYMAAVLVLTALYCLTDMQYMPYHSIQAAVHGLPLIFICFGDERLFGRAGKAVIMGIMCLALLSGALHYNDMRKENKNRALQEAAQWLAQSEYDEGYASFWIGNLAVELSNGGIDVWVWNDIDLAQLDDPDQIVKWLQSKDHDQPPAKGKVFILLTANESYYCDFTRNFSEEDVVYRTAGYQEGAVDEYIIYGFDSYAEMREKFVR